MIQVESIVIKEFRGIRDLTLTFKGKNFAICGPNGTGKSGVVDALEFALTGNVSRLSGEGRGDVSVKEHGPHVDSRNAPDKALVTLTVFIPSLNKRATIERSVKAPSVPTVTPNEPDVVSVLKQLQDHPEFVLSRRELIRYVLASPGKRAEEVQALLRLAQVEQVRARLQKIANACERSAGQLAPTVNEAKESLLRALGIAKFGKQEVLAAANTQRAVLGLLALPELTETTSFKDGLATVALAAESRIPKKQALADIKSASEALDELKSADTAALIVKIAAELRVLANDPAFAADVNRESFLKTGLSFVEADVCPFCDDKWNPAALRKHVQEKLNHLKEVAERRKVAEGTLLPVVTLLTKVRGLLDTILRYAALAAPPIAVDSLKNYRGTIDRVHARLMAFIPLPESLAALGEISGASRAVLDVMVAVENVVAALPEPTHEHAARDALNTAQERLDRYRNEARKYKLAVEKAALTRKVSEVYTTASDEVLKDIYVVVEEAFAGLYRLVNKDDEAEFDAKLVPSLGKLGFDVDFYGRGHFPPGAYHSEGHQDGMGLCLYLALMRHLLGSGFTIAVLDDVLMSVDSGHRREVCRLLKAEFPSTQFILTTHDPIWLKHMQTEGLIASRSLAHFRSWDVTHGPINWDDADVWKEIDDDLANNDISSAAGRLRRYLEYLSGEFCHRLRARVEFRGDAQHDLGDLLPSAVGRLNELFRKAKAAAQSWQQINKLGKIEEVATAFEVVASASNVEQWQINKAVHFNVWATLAINDFRPVVTAFQALLDGFRCKACHGSFMFVRGGDGGSSLRCDCGEINMNLDKKPSQPRT